MTKAANKAKLRPHDIVGHIKSARFLTPRMLVTQWGIQQGQANDLYQRHYHHGRAND